MEEVNEKRASGEYEVVDSQSSRAKLDIWEKFGLLQGKDNKIISGYATCKTRKKVLAFDSRKLGTPSLRKHMDPCGSKAGGSIEKYFLKSKHSLPKADRADTDPITNLAVKSVSRDFRSFETVCGEGSRELEQGLIDVGARAGSVDTLTLLPDPTTVSRRLTEFAEEIRERAEEAAD